MPPVASRDRESPLIGPARYSGLAGFVRPAQARCEISRTLLGLVFIAAIYLVASWALLDVLAQAVAPRHLTRLLSEIASGSSPRGLVILLSSFLPLLCGVIFVTRWWHRRSAATLLGAGAWRTARAVFPSVLGAGLVCAALALFDGNVGRSTPLAIMLAWLPLSLPMLAIQISAEEVLFRGYLLQQLGARWRSRWVWMGVPSALFGLLHYDSAGFGDSAWLLVLWAFAFGCLAADLTARTGNLGAALVLHLVNNATSMFFVGFYGDLDGLALYTIVINARDAAVLVPWLLVDALTLFISWLVIRLILRV